MCTKLNYWEGSREHVRCASFRAIILLHMIMELLRKASEFHDFLHSLAASSQQPTEPIERFQVYGEEYAVTVLPAGTATPFNDFTGQLEGITLVFSEFEPTETQSPSNKLKLSVLDTSLAEECSVDEHSRIHLVKDKFPCFSYQAVNVGQPLSHKRMYLTQSAPLHSGNVGYLFTDSTIAYDAGLIPLSLDKARYIVSLYALASRQNAKAQFPNMWVICKDEKRDIVALGCLNTVGKGSLRSFTVTTEDVFAETQLSPSGKHGAKIKGMLSSGGDYSVFSEYEIANCSATVVNVTEEKLAGDLTVQFAWNSPDAVLCPPSESADAMVKISATPGYLFSPGFATYNELNTLLHLCEIAVGKSTWSSLFESVDEEGVTGTQSLIKTLSDKVGSFLEDISSPLSQPAEVTVVSPTSENKVYEVRKDLDFAERLWLFAKDATSLEDLQQIFAEVFKTVLLGRVQPFVHRNSTSALSTLLRKVLLAPNMDEKQDLAPKFQNLLTESKICVCLVQLGIEKMTRDYRAFFIGADVATGDQLDQFISASRSSQLELCHTLCKLHCILELMSSALSFLKLPPPTLSALFKSALEVYKEKTFVGFSTTPVFSLPLPAYSSAHKSLISFCSSLSPKKWVLSQQKTSNSGVKRAVAVYRSQPLLQNLVEMELEDESRYYVYKAHCECI